MAQMAMSDDRHSSPRKPGTDDAPDERFRFLSALSDDLRTPLVVILGNATQLLDGEESEEKRGSLESIRRSGEQLLLLLDDLLDVRRMQDGPLETLPVESDLRLVAETAIDSARAGVGCRACVSLDVHAAVPERARFDALRVRQALIHLIGNALKFGNEEPVRVRVGFRAPATARIEIEDSGAGLSEDQFERLSAPLVQGTSALVRDFRGPGIGLTLARGIAESLGGSLTCEGDAGLGTRMRLEFPVENPSIPLASEEPLWAGRQILVADDSPDIQRLLRHLLEAEGFEVLSAPDGEKAVEQTLALAPDLVLMDLQMPVLDGFEATRRLRRAEFTGPILALTANSAPNCRNLSLAAGCDGFLPKPIDRQSLLELIGAHLQKSV